MTSGASKAGRAILSCNAVEALLGQPEKNLACNKKFFFGELCISVTLLYTCQACTATQEEAIGQSLGFCMEMVPHSQRWTS
jgi:hypothetical protein